MERDVYRDQYLTHWNQTGLFKVCWQVVWTKKNVIDHLCIYFSRRGILYSCMYLAADFPITNVDLGIDSSCEPRSTTPVAN